jgi:hypothetical protein
MAMFNSAKILNRISKGLLISWLLAAWVLHAQAASDLLFYNSTNGAATIGRIDADGQFSSLFNYPSGSFTSNWSHIVRASNGLLFFYRQTDGLWAVGRADDTVGFVTLRSGHLSVYDSSAGYYLPNFNVVSTRYGILICRGASWSKQPTGGLIGQVRPDGLFIVTQYPNISHWTNVVDTPNGVFFLRAHGGLLPSPFAVGRILPNGTFLQTHSGNTADVVMEQNVVAIGNDLLFLPYARYVYGSLWPQLSGAYRVGGINSSSKLDLRNRTWCGATLAGGFVIPIVLGNDLLLYSVEDGYSPQGGHANFTRLILGGWAQINTFEQSSDFIPSACWGQLKTKYEFSEGFLSRGWSRIVHTANGTLMHNPIDGATVVGSFSADGTFSQLSYNLIDAGYTTVIKMAE